MSTNTRELHCPLCLKHLNDEDSLLVFKTGLDAQDNRTERYKTVRCHGDFIREIVKFGGDSIYLPSGLDHICILHLRCNALNLFWKADEDKLVFPIGDGEDAEFVLDCQTTTLNLTRKTTSEIVWTLRETGKYIANQPNMWFPYPLLRASGKSSLVEMFGSRQVGKTILMLQLAHKDLYVDDRVIQKMDIANYIFIHNQDDFKREIIIRNDWLERPISRPASTAPTPGDVRAIFIKPSIEAQGASRSEEFIQEGREKLWDVVKRLLKEWKEFLKIITPNDENGSEPPPEEETLTPTKKASELLGRDTEKFWHSVVFYDTAGESGRKASPETQRVWQYTDKLVICINAQEIFDQVQDTLKNDESFQRNESIKLACKRIDGLIQVKREKRKKTCLLVTKLDLIPNDVLGNEAGLEVIKRLVERIPVDRAEDKKTDGEIRGILRKWLSENVDTDKRNLIRHLDDDDENIIDKVFFVWTEGLPKMEGVRISPIKDFSPSSGKPGDKVIISLNKAYFDPLFFDTIEKDFEQLVQSVSFSGTPAQILSKKDMKLEVVVPEGAKTGFIEITVDAKFNGKLLDEATSVTAFDIVGDKNEGKPRSYGLLRFLSWCVGVSVQELVKLRATRTAEYTEPQTPKPEGVRMTFGE